MTMGAVDSGAMAEWGGWLGLVIRHGLLLLAVVNPIGSIPIFADLTRELEQRERGNVMNLAVLTSLLIVVVFALIGNWSLKYLFGVTVSELKIAGGILLFVVALRGVIPSGNPSQETVTDPRMLAVFPIAFPLLVGPGAITVTIITTQAIGHILMIVTAIVTFFVVFLIVRNAHRLMHLLGPYAGLIIARLLYIFLAAKAVAMVLDGTDDFLVQFLPAGG
jgi:multiple antibiotic resistance protein